MIPPSIGYNDELTLKVLSLKLKSNREFANFIFLYLPKLQASLPLR